MPVSVAAPPSSPALAAPDAWQGGMGAPKTAVAVTHGPFSPVDFLF